MTGNYIFVYLVTDETTLLPRAVEWIEKDSVNAYARQVEQALIERWTDVEVDVTAYAQRLSVETDVPDCTEDEVRMIIESVWRRFDWLVTDPGDGRSGFFVTWESTDGNREIIGDPAGYATLADAELTAREFFEPENGDEIHGVTEIWLGGDVVATLWRPAEAANDN